MRVLKTALAALVFTAIAVPAFAADSMMAGNQSMMMKPGETVMMMPNGQTMMMPAMKADTDAMKANMDAMIKAAKPMDACMIMMMGTDGKMYMMDDMKMPDGKMACDSMSKMGM
jgi:hypothetical protein